MFCYQCEQTALNKGCILKAGVCGKRADTADMQDELISKLISFSKTNKDIKTLVEGLFITITNVNFDNDYIKNFIKKLDDKISTDEIYDLKNLWQEENEDIKSLKSLVLFGLKGMAAYYYHCLNLGFEDEKIEDFFFSALNELPKNLTQDELFNLVLKVGEVNLLTMALLDNANRTYGNPKPTEVSLTIEKGPFIVVSGHDLKDIELLLKQTEGKGINIYTHGEMLPCHGYSELKKYPHLKGNFGTAWQNQKVEFKDIPAPVLFTTNCIMPPLDNYKDRIFTTNVVSFPDCKYIDEKKDFSPLIEKALELKGYSEDKEFFGINGGNKVLTGCGREFILENASKIIDLINQGKIKHIFLVGGCDGAKTGRNYYTEFVKQTPKDSLILTLACGKYRFNDLDLGEIEGIPRILDMGQCNDAYGAIFVAQALAKALNTEINNLPLHFILSWYEQKAVCILLTLFYLKIENIYLGPSLPVFISKNVLQILIDKFKIKPITTSENDLKEILNL